MRNTISTCVWAWSTLFYFLPKSGNVKLNLSVVEFVEGLINSSGHASRYKEQGSGEDAKSLQDKRRWKDPYSFSN